METTEKKKILIVEDEKNIAHILAFNLDRAGYAFDIAYDGEDGLKKALTGNHDLILLDIMLPKLDGFAVCREVRKKSAVPIIMVTAKEEEVDNILGLNLGADDYVTKPFSMKLLIARINANIRRSASEKLDAEDKSSAVITVRELAIDNEKYLVKKRGTPIELSKIEYELLLYLVKNIDKVCSREELISRVWGYDGYFGDVRTVDVTVTRLRSKIEDVPAEPDYIMTKWGKGYYIKP